MDSIVQEIEYGTSVIEYTIERCNRKTLGIYVHPDGTVVVKAPEDATDSKIKEKVHHRAAWIQKQQRYFSSFGIRTPKREYVSGESHLYLGRQYMLRIIKGKANSVNYKNTIIEIECRNKKDAKSLLQAWYHAKATQKFDVYAKPLIDRFKKYKVCPSGFEIRNMEKRWGCCSPKGTITLNSKLIHAPRICIEYVIIHELCHLVYQNHTKDFYKLLSKEMPQWERWKEKLERMMM